MIHFPENLFSSICAPRFVIRSPLYYCLLAQVNQEYPADFHRTFNNLGFSCGYASGLIFLKEEQEHVICNPNKGQYFILPKLKKHIRSSKSFLGFYPIDKKFNILFIGADPSCYDGGCRILTLDELEEDTMSLNPFYLFGRGMHQWGFLYYLATKLDETSSVKKIVCFDVN